MLLHGGTTEALTSTGACGDAVAELTSFIDRVALYCTIYYQACPAVP